MLRGRKVRILLKGQAIESHAVLQERKDQVGKSILASFKQKKEVLRQKPQYGDVIEKKKHPSHFTEMGVTNLYRVELSNYWRMLYTVQGNEEYVFVFILWISDHQEYDKLLGYKGR